MSPVMAFLVSLLVIVLVIVLGRSFFGGEGR